MRFTRYQLIEYRSSDEAWLEKHLSVTGQVVMPNGAMITIVEVDAHQITVSLEAALREAREEPATPSTPEGQDGGPDRG